MAMKEFQRTRSGSRGRKRSDLLPLPEDCKLHLDFNLLPRERVVFQEKPQKRRIFLRNFPLLLLSAMAFFVIPIVSGVFAAVAEFSILSDVEALLMLGLLLVDVILIAVWLLVVRTMGEAYVVTENRVMIIRPSLFGGLTHSEAPLDALANDQGFAIRTFTAGASMTSSQKMNFGFVCDGGRLENALLQVMPQPVQTRIRQGFLFQVGCWLSRLAVAALLSFVVAVLLPFLAHVLTHIHYSNSAATPDEEDARVPWGGFLQDALLGDGAGASSIDETSELLARLLSAFSLTSAALLLFSLCCTVAAVVASTRGTKNIIHLLTSSHDNFDGADDHEMIEAHDYERH